MNAPYRGEMTYSPLRIHRVRTTAADTELRWFGSEVRNRIAEPRDCLGFESTTGSLTGCGWRDPAVAKPSVGLGAVGSQERSSEVMRADL
jgi:hypothetical protein